MTRSSPRTPCAPKMWPTSEKPNVDGSLWSTSAASGYRYLLRSRGAGGAGGGTFAPSVSAGRSTLLKRRESRTASALLNSAYLFTFPARFLLRGGGGGVMGGVVGGVVGGVAGGVVGGVVHAETCEREADGVGVCACGSGLSAPQSVASATTGAALI